MFFIPIRKVLNESTVQPFHLNQKFLIVVTQSMENVAEVLHDLFSIILNVGLFKVNILIEDRNESLWSLHFFIPYIQSCYSFTVFQIGIFSPGNYTSPLDVPFKNLFPPEKFKFPGCSLYVATFPFPPFVIAHEPISDTSQIQYEGIDIILVNQISKTLNLIPKYMQSSDANKRGNMFKNGTATGAFGMVKIAFCSGSKTFLYISFYFRSRSLMGLQI